MDLGQGVPSAKMVLDYFTTTWTSWAGWPQIVRVDRGKEFMEEFADKISEHGVEFDGIPLESPWLLRKAKRRGAEFEAV